MTSLQLILASGVLLGVGLTLLIAHLVPKPLDAADVAYRYSLDGIRNQKINHAASASKTSRLGAWAYTKFPSASSWNIAKPADLELLNINPYTHLGAKLGYGFAGLILAPIVTYLFAVLGWHIPIVLPFSAALGLGIYMFIAPDLTATSRAKAARLQFLRSLAAYMDLVALARANTAGPRQALEQAARIGDSWAFKRIEDVLVRSSLAATPAWDALNGEAEHINIPELGEVGDIMRLTSEGSQVSAQLKERARALRIALLKDELARTNAVRQRMQMPLFGLVMVFTLIFITPPILRMLGLGA